MLLSLLHSLRDALGPFPATKLIIALTLLLSLIAIAILHYGTISTTRRALRNLQRQGVSASNMADQFDPVHAIPESSATSGPIRIKSIFIHPAKSCGAIELPRALLTKSGFLHDRCFAIATEVVDDPATGEVSWRFISQRTKPSMCHIKTELYLPRDTTRAQEDPLVRSGGCVLLSFADPDPPSVISRIETLLHTRDPAAKPLIHLIAPLSPPATSHPLKTFGIHARQARGIDLYPLPSVAAALPKLKRYLDVPESRGLTLMRCTDDTLTRTDRNLAPLRHIGTPSVHGYTDQQPVNVNSLSSVHAVSALLPPENQPLDALRFRANLWITGAPAFAEESWKRCRILPKSSSSSRAAVAPKLSVVCRTSRCTMPNVNLKTGLFDADLPQPGKKGRPQPSATLVEHRTAEDGNPSALGYIGVHCVPEDQDLEEAREQRAGLYVEVGDEIEVLETGVHLFGSTGNDY
ncbi:molybdopterin cofactor [Colletotrichum musicola]|uniref:Molybdopterin cofactor n=1 Tax=Colletotrichum musicola TaxID=2175873 RepID=A0A8H6KVM7_9PEZI|nr:molybdopterin cofactor [Colletotrichum musicola]